MGYELLRGLYLGKATNADLTSLDERNKIHVRTPLDIDVPKLVATGRDLVVTGNPGDGKSHLVRRLAERSRLGEAVVELDLSAKDDQRVVQSWEQAAAAGRPFVLCANEGPLVSLLTSMAGSPVLASRRAELLAQLGRLVASSPDHLPPEPSAAVLIDLADRELLDVSVISEAVRLVAKRDFVPDEGDWVEDSIIHVAVETLWKEEARQRFARVLSIAGRRAGLHVSFRQLWAAISYAMCGGESVAQLQLLCRTFGDGTGQFPLDRLASGQGQGALFDAVRAYADPARAPWPELDEDLWFSGVPSGGSWLEPHDPFEPPALAWEQGDQEGALRRFDSIKRLVALNHSFGEELLDLLEGDTGGLTGRSDSELLDELLRGLRRMYVSEHEESAAPAWLAGGLPVWSSLTYAEGAVSSRPHVAVSWLPRGELELRRPVRPPWLGSAIGPPPELVWLHHRPSGVALRVDGELQRALRRAASTHGPSSPPEPVQRFLARVAGWQERQPVPPTTHVAFLSCPRGELVTTTITQGPHGPRYGAPHAGR